MAYLALCFWDHAPAAWIQLPDPLAVRTHFCVPDVLTMCAETSLHRVSSALYLWLTLTFPFSYMFQIIKTAALKLIK
jgi:hypothetical protein